MRLAFFLIHIFLVGQYAVCRTASFTEEEAGEGKGTSLASSSSFSSSQQAEVAFTQADFASTPQSRSPISGCQTSLRDDLALLGLCQQGAGHGVVLRQLWHRLARSEFQNGQSQENQRQRQQGEGQRQRFRSDYYECPTISQSHPYCYGNSASSAAFPHGIRHDTRYHYTGQSDRRSSGNICYRCHSDISFFGTLDSSCSGARSTFGIDVFTGKFRPGGHQGHCHPVERAADLGDDWGKESQYRYSEFKTPETAEQAAEADYSERFGTAAMDRFQERYGEIHEPQTCGGKAKAGRNPWRDCSSQAHCHGTSATDSVSLPHSERGSKWGGETTCLRDSSGTPGASYLRSHRGGHRPRGGAGGGELWGSGGHGSRAVEAEQRPFQNSTTGSGDTGFTEEKEEEGAKNPQSRFEWSFLRRPCPSLGILRKDYHGESRKCNKEVRFEEMPTYHLFGFEEGDSFSLMQDPLRPPTTVLVKVWFASHRNTATPRTLAIETDVLELGLLETLFRELWEDHLGQRDFSFRRLTIQRELDPEEAIHFIVFHTDEVDHGCAVLIAVHSHSLEAGTVTRWFPWSFHCQQICGNRILRETLNQEIAFGNMAINDFMLELDEPFAGQHGDFIEFFLDEDFHSLMQTTISSFDLSCFSKSIDYSGAPIIDPDEVLGINLEETVLEEPLRPALGDIFLYELDHIPQEHLRPKNIVRENDVIQGFNFIMYALLDNAISLPRRDGQIREWSEYRIRTMIYEVWNDFQPRDIDAYFVRPQPDRLSRDGFVLVLHLRSDDASLAPGHSLVLCEHVIWDNRNDEDLTEASFAACSLRSPGLPRSWLEQTTSADLRASIDQTSMVTLIRKKPAIPHERHHLQTGSLVSFLLERSPILPSLELAFGLQPDFFIRLDDFFSGCPPRQGVTLCTHGFQAGHLGMRNVTLFRPQVMEPQVLLNSVVALWPERPVEHLRILGLRPGIREQAEDGSLLLHLIALFDYRGHHRIGLTRQQREQDDIWTVRELPSVTSFQSLAETLGLPTNTVIINGGGVQRPAHLPLLWGFFLHLGEDTTTEIMTPTEQDDSTSLLQFPKIGIQLEKALEDSTYLPLTSAGGAPTVGQICCDDTLAVLHQLENHRVLPHYATPEGLIWDAASEPWVRCEWLLHQVCDELCFYTDGSAGAEHGGLGVVLFARSQSTWYYGGFVCLHLSGCTNAHVAELAAMIVALKWAGDEIKRNLHLGGWVPFIRFCFDATSAGKKILGEYGGDANPSLTSTGRSLARLLTQRFDAQLHGEHIYGHRGEPGNEGANTIAQWAASHADMPQDAFLMSLISGQFATPLDWGWLFWRADLQQHLEGGTFSLPLPELPEVESIAQTSSEESLMQTVQYSMKFATANAMTLKHFKDKKLFFGLHGVTRLEAVLQQCHEAHINIVAFQETRLQKLFGQTNPFYHLFFAPASPQGHYGIIIGISKLHPIGKVLHEDGSTTLEYLKAEQCSYVDFDHRRLLLHVRHPWFHCVLVAAHGPHTQSSDLEASQWWSDLHQAIPSKLKDIPRVVLMDANAHLGDIPSVAVGSHQQEPQDRNGELFHHYLIGNDVFLPATFSHFQRGEGGTWRHPRGHLLRNDFIGLPQCWKKFQIETFVEQEVDLSLSREDHLVAACTLHCQQCHLRAPSSSKTKSRLFLPNNDSTKELLTEAAWVCPEIPWHWDVNRHEHALTRHIRSHLGSRCTKAIKRPFKPSITEGTWKIIVQKKRLRQQLHEISAQERLANLKALFAAWRNGDCQLGPNETALPHLRRQRVLLHYQFQTLGLQVKEAMRLDDQTFFENLAAEGQKACQDRDYQKIWQCVRRQLPKHRLRKAARNPLSLAALDDQWQPHFEALEVGHALTDGDLMEDFINRTRQRIPQPVPRDFLPSINLIETTLRQAQPNKAPGPDQIQAEIFGYGAAAWAPVVWDIMAKIYISQIEPLSWKQGTMVPILKKGRIDLAENYRGILLAPALSKRFHSLVRRQLMDWLRPRRSQGQLGGFPHGEVLFGIQGLRLAARLASLHNKPSVALFLDLRHAFHHVVRELLTGTQASSTFHLEYLLQHLCSDGLDIRGLLQWLRIPGLMERLEMPGFLQQLIEEVHTDTHFRLPNSTIPIRTSRGSRPGSPIADSFFHTLMLDMQFEVERIVQEEEDHTATCASIGLPSVPVTWADDVAVLLTASSNENIIPMTKRVTEKLSAAFERRGFCLNLAKGKTGAVISFKGPNAVEHRQQLLQQDEPGCEVFQGSHQRRLHFTSTYTHLGALFEMEGGLRAEVFRRIGLAWTAFIQLSKQIFTNQHLTIKVRLQLFESLIASKLWFGSGTWSTLSQKLLQKLDGVTMRMIRRIVGGHRQTYQGPTDKALRSLYEIPTARARLARDRLLYVARLYSFGPTFVHDLIEAEWRKSLDSWKHLLLADLHWLDTVLQIPGGLVLLKT